MLFNTVHRFGSRVTCKGVQITSIFQGLCMKNTKILPCLSQSQDTRRQFSISTSKNSAPPKKWKIGKINHVAVGTPDLNKGIKFFESILGAKVSEKHALPEHGVTVSFVELGDTKLELLHPLGEKSPIENFLEKNKAGGMHHICIEVDDIEAAMADIKANNIRMLSEKPRIGAHGKPVVFLHPKDCCGMLLELEEA